MATQGKKMKRKETLLPLRKQFSSFLHNTAVEDVKVQMRNNPPTEELCLKDHKPLDIKVEPGDWPMDDALERLLPANTNWNQTPQQGECRCCLSQGKFVPMDQRLKLNGSAPSYTEMLHSTLGLTLARARGAPLICSACAVQLRQALAFRKKVLAAERAFLARESLNVVLKTEYDTCASDINGETEDCSSIAAPGITPHGGTTDCSIAPPGITPHGKTTDCSIAPPGITLPQQSIENSLPKVNAADSDEDNSWDFDDDTPLNIIPLANQKLHPTSKIQSESVDSDLKNTWKRPPREKTKCGFCTEMLTNMGMKMHLLCRHFACYYCKETFKDSKEARDHVVQKHPFKCSSCGITFESISKQRGHYRTVHGVECNICKEKLPLDKVWQHKWEVHRVTKPKCGVCDMVFHREDYLSRHQRRVHMGQREFPCQQCDYISFNKQSLSKHMLVHGIGAEKKYECKHCGKKFVRPGTLVFHERIHTGDKRAVCKLCGEAFVQRASLKYHLEKHHPGENC